MPRILTALLCVASLSLACKPPAPGPTPEPTPGVDPKTVATCYTPAPGAPGGGVCQNADGNQVTCPDDATTKALPPCP